MYIDIVLRSQQEFKYVMFHLNHFTYFIFILFIFSSHHISFSLTC